MKTEFKTERIVLNLNKEDANKLRNLLGLHIEDEFAKKIADRMDKTMNRRAK